MELNLKDKRVLVTGGSKGIGLAIKNAFELEGAEVISWSRSEGIDLMKEIPDLENIDILINNVGGIGRDATKWELAMQKNYNTMVKMTDNFLRQNFRNAQSGLPLQKYGRVITISSIYGTYPGKNPGFSAAKAAQIMYMKSLSKLYPGITFNCVSPGEVRDAGTPKDVKLKAADVADLVVFLCSDKSKYINGQNIVIGE